MITLFLMVCYYLFIWPIVMLFKLLIWPVKLFCNLVLLPFRLIGWLFSLPERLLFPGRNNRIEKDDTLDDFLDWVEEYECLTDDD